MGGGYQHVWPWRYARASAALLQRPLAAAKLADASIGERMIGMALFNLGDHAGAGQIEEGLSTVDEALPNQ
jgi:hypothetical protein